MASIFGNIASIISDIGFTGMDAAFTSQGLNATTLDEVVEQGKSDETAQYAADLQNEYVNGPRGHTSPLIGPASSGSSSSFSLISSIVCLVLVVAIM